jgi:cell division septation protein DedD
MDDFKRDLEDYFCRFTFGQFVTLILIEIVTLFFIFYLGARYGPDLLGGREDRRKEIALPKQSPKNVDDIVGSPSVNYTYPDVLTGDGSKAIRVKPSGVSADEIHRQAPDQQATQQAQERTDPRIAPPAPAPQAAPSASAEEEQAPTEAPAEEEAAPVGKYSIQVGSFPTLEDATKASNVWKAKGYHAFLSAGQIPNKGTWYRVRLGTFPSRESAEKFLERLKEKEKTSGLVVLSRS